MSLVRKVQLVSAALGFACVAAAMPVAADSYSVNSSTSVSGSTSGACASTSLQAQDNGASIVDQSVSQCAP
jgi:hypothetical protein